MKEVKFSEIVHQWSGLAVVKQDGVYSEVQLGVVTTDKKLKETGVKELFEAKKPVGTISISVEKLVDITTVYKMNLDEFKKLATVEQPTEEDPKETEPNKTK